MFFRLKATGPYQYLQIAESLRVDGKVRQRILATLGRLDVLQESGQLDSLLRSGFRFSNKLAVLDAHADGRTQPAQVLSIGPDLVFGRLWVECGIQAVLREALVGRHFEFDVERAIYLTVLHRLVQPGSDRAAETWRQNYRIPGTENLALHHLYRAMAWLGEELDEGSELKDVSRCTKDLLEEALFHRDEDLFSGIDLVFFDTTSIYFEGAGGQSLGRHGFSKDHRPDLRQMVVGAALDVKGRPICSLLWPGNITDSKAVLPLIHRLQKRFRVRRVSLVADRGMISHELIEALEGESIQCGYILGVRMRSTAEVHQKVLTDTAPWAELVAERERSTDPSPLKVKEVRVDGRRYVVCLNEEQRRKDAADREAIVKSLRERLGNGGADKELIGNSGYRKFVKVRGEAHYEIDEAKIESEAKYDGIWVLRTNLDLENELVARTYKHLWTVEDTFRTMKTVLSTRPIYHKNDDTIRGHVFCSFLALRLRHELEQRLEGLGKPWEWGEVIRGIDKLQEVTLGFENRTYAMRSELTGQIGLAIKAARVALPPTLREVPPEPPLKV